MSQEPKRGEGVKGSRLQSLDLSEEGVCQKPKRREGVKGSRLQSLDLSEQGVGQEPKRRKESRDPDSRAWICPKRA